jgi:hypothetical protein
MTKEKWREEGGEYLRRGGTDSRHDEVETWQKEMALGAVITLPSLCRFGL